MQAQNHNFTNDLKLFRTKIFTAFPEKMFDKDLEEPVSRMEEFGNLRQSKKVLYDPKRVLDFDENGELELFDNTTLIIRTTTM